MVLIQVELVVKLSVLSTDVTIFMPEYKPVEVSPHIVIDQSMEFLLFISYPCKDEMLY